eukprot:1006079-Rhodomonas_salina.1
MEIGPAVHFDHLVITCGTGPGRPGTGGPGYPGTRIRRESMTYVGTGVPCYLVLIDTDVNTGGNSCWKQHQTSSSTTSSSSTPCQWTCACTCLVLALVPVVGYPVPGTPSRVSGWQCIASLRL